jgi:hypothetical protein
MTLLTEAVVTQVQQALVPSPQGLDVGLGMAFADLAVTGRRAFGDFVSKVPQEGGPVEAAAMAKLTASGLSGVTPQLVRKAMSEVLDRAYQVAWFLRAQTTRGDLGWMAVSARTISRIDPSTCPEHRSHSTICTSQCRVIRVRSSCRPGTRLPRQPSRTRRQCLFRSGAYRRSSSRPCPSTTGSSCSSTDPTRAWKRPPV